MRVPLTKYGWPEVVVLPAVVLAAIVAYLLVGILFLLLWEDVNLESSVIHVQRDGRTTKDKEDRFILPPRTQRERNNQLSLII
jgi:hypothetical protein